MAKIVNIEKNDCLKFIGAKDSISIHPLLNAYFYYKHPIFDNKPDMCNVLPQLIPNEGTKIFSNINVKVLKDNLEYLETKINTSVIEPDNKKSKISQDNKISPPLARVPPIEPVFNFTLPINKNNLLDIVFHITTMEDLNNWLFTNDLNKLPIRMVETVLNLFWENYYNIIDEDINLFIEINKKIIKILFEKEPTNKIIEKIVNKIIKNNYGKKINYLSKIKKYLTKYI